MTPAPHPLDVRRVLREIERLAFVAGRALDERDSAAAREAVEALRERVARL